jgi:diamine N-acetyltransferase
MITLKDITEDNFFEYIGLEVSEEQRYLVTDPITSLAHAWLYYDIARPFAIYNEDVMVGYLMLDINSDWGGTQKTCTVWRLMIDKKHQKKGYGKAAIQQAIQYLKDNHDPDIIMVNLIQGNDIAESLYRSFGFVTCTEVVDDQFKMVLNLRN